MTVSYWNLGASPLCYFTIQWHQKALPLTFLRERISFFMQFSLIICVSDWWGQEFLTLQEKNTDILFLFSLPVPSPFLMDTRFLYWSLYLHPLPRTAANLWVTLCKKCCATTQQPCLLCCLGYIACAGGPIHHSIFFCCLLIMSMKVLQSMWKI